MKRRPIVRLQSEIARVQKLMRTLPHLPDRDIAKICGVEIEAVEAARRLLA